MTLHRERASSSIRLDTYASPRLVPALFGRSASRSSMYVRLAAFACVLGMVVVVSIWGSASLFPGLLGNFAASLAAFMLALAWERDREAARSESDAALIEQQRATEVRRRFAPARLELEKNAQSLKELGKLIVPDPYATPVFTYAHPQLLEGAWTANAPRLSELVADYDLIGDLAMTYGRIEELRWRLRHRSENMTKDLDEMTIPLITELRGEVDDLLERVGEQIDHPSVQALGLLHVKGGALGATVGTTASIETKVIRADQTSVSSSASEISRPQSVDEDAERPDEIR